MKNSTIFLVAMEYERKNIFKDYSLTKIDDDSPFQSFQFDNNIIVETGIGKSNSAAATQFVLDKYSPKRIINIGLCGSLTKNHKKGDVVKVGKCVFHDVDVRVFGHKLGQVPGSKIVEYVIDKISDILCLTGDQFIDDSEKVETLLQDFPGVKLIEMELASIAHILHFHNQLDILESYKIVSDDASDDADSQFYDGEEVVFGSIRERISGILSE